MAYNYEVNGTILPTPDADPEYTEERLTIKSWRDGQFKYHSVGGSAIKRKVELKWSKLTKSQLRILQSLHTNDSNQYVFHDITDGDFEIYTGSDLKYKKHRVDKDTGETVYKDVSLSFIER